MPLVVNFPKLKEVVLQIGRYGIEIIENPRNVIVQKIKQVINDMIFKEEKNNYR